MRGKGKDGGEGMAEDITLLQGNCLEMLKEIPNEIVDCVITDPPYCVGASSNGVKSSNFDNRMLIPFFEQVLYAYPPLWRRYYRGGGSLCGSANARRVAG